MSHEHDDEATLGDEDIVEVVEDDEGDEPMEEDDDDEHLMEEDDDEEREYDGELVVGAPVGPEEEEEYEEHMRREAERQRDDNSWGVTSLHKPQQSIFVLSLHPSFPNPPLALSGGEDDLGYLFCPIPDSTFPPIKLTGHTDSVVAAGWNFDGEMVATGGMDGKIRVWRRVKGRTGEAEWKDWEFLTALDTGDEISWMTWHPKGNVLAAGCEDSSVWLFNLPSGDTMTVLSSHTDSCSAGLFPAPYKSLLTASLDSTLILWDPRTSQSLFKTSIFCPPNSPNLDPTVHGITALAVSPDGKLAAVGSNNGSVRLVNLPKGDIVGRLEGHAEGESVEALEFVDLLNGAGGGKGVVVVSGGTDGRGFVWDVATARVRAEIKHDEPITSLAAHPLPSLHLVTTASADSTLKTWDIRTGALISTHKGHAGVVNGVAVGSAPSPEQGQVIVTAGDEGVSLIWKA
ncbi:ribosome assembly protein SQT1, partial [Tremellales sp. Uapishka_1]